VSEYRALRESVLRMWADLPDRDAAYSEEITRFNEAIDEAIAESVSHYSGEVERWRNIFLGVLGHDLRSPLSAILMTSELGIFCPIECVRCISGASAASG